MKSGRSVSPGELDCHPAEGCVYMCGMCPAPPGSTRCLWRGSDEFKRRFVVELLLRCRSVKVLESIQTVLGVTPWSLSTYTRWRSPATPQDPRRLPEGEPADTDMREICDRFSSCSDRIKLRYLCRVFSICDAELLRTVENLTSVLLVRQKRGLLQFNVSNHKSHQEQDSDDDSGEDPALMVVPGSSKSVSGVSRYRDFIGCLPVDLAKRILGLLDEHSLRRCHKVSPQWQCLAHETVEELKFKRLVQDKFTAMLERCQSINKASPTYANMVEVPVPVKGQKKVYIQPSVQKVKPFEAAYAKIKTKMVQMEERNVYCGAYFTTVLLDKEDRHRVADYRGGSFMATGSKDRAVQLLYVAPDPEVVSVIKVHVGSIRAVLLWEDRELLFIAGCDSSIRCWSLKMNACVMALYGHTGLVNCMDVHDDRLVSGAKDCLVKVWSLDTGKHFEDFLFKHPCPVRCVKIGRSTVYSSCDRGLVKIWDLENAALLRVIDAHRSSVKCLFFDKWHLLSGDSSGQVMAWSVNCEAKECLMTFDHPKQVKSLTLVYLRVITGCVDGKIRIFNFLTGRCLREITAEAETGRILSLHVHDDSIIVNASSSVKHYQFAKVFWDYPKGKDVKAQEGLVSKKSAVSLRKLPLTSVRADHTAQVASLSQNMNNEKPKRDERLHHICFLPTPATCRAQDRGRCEAAKQSLMLSEKATSERIKRRGLHHPLTRDSILLRVNAIQRARCVDEVSINMEFNAQLRDSWGPQMSQDPQTLWHTHGGHHRRARTCFPLLKRAAANAIQGRAVSSAPDTSKRCRSSVFSVTCRRVRLKSWPTYPQRCTNTDTSLPKIGPVGPLTGTRLQDLMQNCERKRSKRDKQTKKTHNRC